MSFDLDIVIGQAGSSWRYLNISNSKVKVIGENWQSQEKSCYKSSMQPRMKAFQLWKSVTKTRQSSKDGK